MKKVRKMLFSIVLLVLAIFQISTQMKKTEAATAGEIQYLQRDNKGFYSIQKWNGSEWIYVTYSITYYTDSNGVKRIAYCIDPDLKGIGWIKGEYAGYDVKLKDYYQMKNYGVYIQMDIHIKHQVKWELKQKMMHTWQQKWRHMQFLEVIQLKK